VNDDNEDEEVMAVMEKYNQQSKSPGARKNPAAASITIFILFIIIIFCLLVVIHPRFFIINYLILIIYYLFLPFLFSLLLILFSDLFISFTSIFLYKKFRIVPPARPFLFIIYKV
jgi:hypothetical protein